MIAQDLNLADIGRLPMFAKALCSAAAAIVALAIGYFLVLADLRALWAGAERQEASLRAEHERKASLATALATERERRGAAAAELAALLATLPMDVEVPALVEDITRAAAARGLTIAGFTLAEEREAALYVEQPIAVVATGDYHQIGAFAADLATLPRIVTLHDFDLRAGPAGGGDLTMATTAKTYRRRQDGTTLAGVDSSTPAEQRLEAASPTPIIAYRSAGERSPFEIGAGTAAGDSAQPPDSSRPTQPLERHALAQLEMVGTLAAHGERHALLRAPDGEIHRLSAGDYLGADHGRIGAVHDTGIDLVETVPNGLGGWMARPRTLAMRPPDATGGAATVAQEP